MTYGMSLRELLEDWMPEAPDIVIAGISQDSRQINEGDVFVAVQGEHHHGLNFSEQAVAKGCCAIVHDGKVGVPSMGVPVVEIQELSRLLGQIACRFWAAPSDLLTLIGVTGTNGKTSVSHFLAQSWQRALGAGGMIGTLGYGPLDSLQTADWTTPDVFRLNQVLANCLDAGIDHVAMEVSSHALEQDRCQTLQFDAAVFTNLSRDHLDYHRDMAAYEQAKFRLFTEFAPRFSVINHDDLVGRKWIDQWSGAGQVLSYGLAPGAELTAEVLALDSDGMALRLQGPWGSAEFRTGLMGGFNVSNLLACAGTLALLGMEWSEVVEQLEQLESVPGRMCRMGGEPGQPVVIVDYAHTPDALAHALEAARCHLSGRLVCVFGCGGNRDRGKRPQMGRVAEEFSDQVVVTSDNPRFESVNSIINDILSGFDQPQAARVEADRAIAIMRAVSDSGPGDVVLVAGKGHEGWQEIAGKRMPFNDEAVVRAALEAAA